MALPRSAEMPGHGGASGVAGKALARLAQEKDRRNQEEDARDPSHEGCRQDQAAGHQQAVSLQRYPIDPRRSKAAAGHS